MSLFPNPGGATVEAFTPLSLSPYIWIRGDDVNISDTDKVDQWNDKSGNSRHLAGVTTTRPSLLTADAGFNSQDAIAFTEDVDILTLTGLSIAQPFSVFFAIRQNSWAANDRHIELHSSGNVLDIQNADATSPNFFQYTGVIANTISAMTIGTEFLLTSIFNGASASQQLNATAAVTGGTTGTATANQVRLGARTAGAYGADQDVAELVIIEGAVTGEDLTSMQTYFNTRYSLW